MLRDEIIASANSNIRTLEKGTGYETTFSFDKSFTGFQGHFPQEPVLPAFVQLLLGQCAVGMLNSRHCRLLRIQRAKFLKTIQPGQIVNVRWNEQAINEGLRCDFTLTVDNERAAVFTIELAIEGKQNA
jgi:3-hydroxyacyl-[acyl-carrier-protein] dehydratase